MLGGLYLYVIRKSSAQKNDDWHPSQIVELFWVAE